MQHIIRLAMYKDIKNLMSLNNKWQKNLVPNFDFGFLSAAFEEQTFKALIESSDIIVANSGRKIAGYYLINNYSQDGILKIHRNLLRLSISNGWIPKDSKVGLGCQVLVDREYQGTGLRERMLEMILENSKSKYDFLFSTISKDNIRSLKTHIKDAWTIKEYENLYIIFRSLKNCKK